MLYGGCYMKRLLTMILEVWNGLFSDNPEDIICPVCGYYCSGNGGYGCIDKPGFIDDRQEEDK
jgi:hypothetical protein